MPAQLMEAHPLVEEIRNQTAIRRGPIVYCLESTDLPEGIPAFPGSGGMFATGGRGGQVIQVTNLNDNGPGSFRAAIESEGPRTIIFRVAGIIALESNIDLDNPDITIAGQSAPGDGICLANHSLNINTENVILRHLRVRRGRPDGGQGSDNIGGNPIGRIIVWKNISMEPIRGRRLTIRTLEIIWTLSVSISKDTKIVYSS